MRSRAGSAQHTCDEKVAVRPACPPASAFPRRRTPPFRPPRRSAPGEGRRTRARSAASSGARCPPLSAPPFAATDGVAPGPRPVLVLRSPGSSWWLRRPLLSGGALWRPEAVRLPHGSCDAFARRSETQTLRPPGRDRLFFLGFCPTSLRLCASWRRPPWQGDHEQPSPAARHGGPRPAAGGPRPPARRGCPHATAEALAGDLPASSCPVGIASLGSSRAVEQLY